MIAAVKIVQNLCRAGLLRIESVGIVTFRRLLITRHGASWSDNVGRVEALERRELLTAVSELHTTSGGLNDPIVVGSNRLSFAAPVNYAESLRVNVVVTADFNRDGPTDLPVGTLHGGVEILLGDDHRHAQ